MEVIGSAVARVVIQQLAKVGITEVSLIQHLDKDTLQLKMTLAMIEGYLDDADKKLITQSSVKIWLRDLTAVAFRADSALDELNYHLLGNKVKEMMTVKDRVSLSFSSYQPISGTRKMAHTIRQIRNDFESLNQRAMELGLERMLVHAHDAALPDAAFETDSFTFDPIFIGRDYDVPRLVDMMNHGPEEMKFSIISIVGMGGMGKTTLTRKVFNHQNIQTRFGERIWVHVSQSFDPIIILKKILASLTRKTPDVLQSREVTLARLRDALKEKTYLLVLDDVWNEDQEKWDNFLNSLWGVTPLNGNRIILTTRNTHVASVVNPLHTHILNGISDEECWSIIKVKAFRKGSEVPSQFESLGGKIARRCQGLPLAANVVGGVLQGKSEQEWLSIQQKWLTDDEGDSIFKILRLSFDSLPLPSLKRCFAFFSIFPKGSNIVKERLIELWMAEGFLQTDRRNEMESVGEKFVDMLLQSSLLQVVLSYHGDVLCCMHDLVHDLATSFTSDDNDDINQVRYMSGSSPISKEVAKCLRTLFFHGEISVIKFSEFKCLHTLTLTNHDLKELPSSISKLIHLRELNISDTRIHHLPDSICELYHLQTLRAEWRLYELPSTFKYLINIRHIHIYPSGEIVKLPPEIGRLTCLQTLPFFSVGNKKGFRIEELGSLKNLKGKLIIGKLENVHSKEEAEKANIFKNPNLFHLEYRWSCEEGGRNHEVVCDLYKPHPRSYVTDGKCDEESVLEGLQPHPNLKVLKIKGFNGKRFPLWTLKMAVRDETLGSWVELNKLTEITLKCCYRCEEIPKFGHLPNLKYLFLSGFINVHSIDSSFYGIEKQTSIAFPALERLTMRDMLELREWAEVEELKAFPHLKYLEITSFLALETLPDCLFNNNQNLTKFLIDECPKLRELPECRGVPRELHITNCNELMELPRGMVESGLPFLEILELKQLSSLKNLPMLIDGLTKSARLTKLMISGVPKFMATSSVESWPFHSLRYLVIDASINESSDSVAIKETVDGMLHGSGHSYFYCLHLKGMEIWKSLPESIENVTDVHNLKLCNFGIEKLPDQWIGNLSSLETLALSSCKSLSCLPSVDALRRLTKLRDLILRDCPEAALDIDEWNSVKPHLNILVDGKKIYPIEVSQLSKISESLFRCFH